MKHYTNSEWHFGLDIPEHWNAFPAAPTNSPNEVIRFASKWLSPTDRFPQPL
jgi:hypothetical protein